MTEQERERQEKAFHVALIAAILLSGRNSPGFVDENRNLSMLVEEKRIAIMEAVDILEMANKAFSV